LTVGPPPGDPALPWSELKYCATEQIPASRDDFNTKRTLTAQIGVGIKAMASAVPSFGLEYGRSRSSAEEQIPVAKHLNLGRVLIGEDAKTREHYWLYHLSREFGKQHVPRLCLPSHTSKAKYSRTPETLLEVLAVSIKVMFEVNRNSTPAIVFQNRAQRRLLSIGYKHLVARFSVTVTRDNSNSNNLIEFGTNECAFPITMHKHCPLLPSDLQGSDSFESVTSTVRFDPQSRSNRCLIGFEC